MSGFIANSSEYNISTENEISVVLSHFNSEFVFDIITNNLQRKNYNSIPAPNVVDSIENNFKIIKENYKYELQQIEGVRIQTYKEIIKTICDAYNIKFNDEIDVDYFSAAHYIYDFLIANFSTYLVSFFANFIYKERNSIFESMNLNSMKKSKDSSTIYGKKMYKDIKIAVINANLEYVVNNICSYDISLSTILSFVYPDKNIVNYLNNVLLPIQDFYKYHYASIFNTDIKSIILTNIRLTLHTMAINVDQNNLIGGNQHEYEQ